MLTLIVDDLPEMREMVHMNLEEAYPRMTYLFASSGEEAKELLKKYGERISLVVSDFNMPGGNGGVVFKQWQETHFHVPFIILTSEVKAARKAILNGQKSLWQRLAFLEKDGTFSELPKVVSRLLPKSFISIPLAWFKEEVAVNYPIYLPLNDKKIVQYAHEGSSFEKGKLRELVSKGARSFLIPSLMVMERGLQWPHFNLHSHEKKVAPSLLSSFQSFKSLHRELLVSFYFDEKKFDRTCRMMEGDVEKFIKTNIFKWYCEKKLTVKDYILNHSLLVGLVSIMILDELDLSNATNRRYLMESCLFHDLFKDDDSAYHQDLIEENPDVSGHKKAVMQLLNIARDLELSTDCERVIESLALHRLPHDFHKGNHKLARVAKTAHSIVSDLYKSSFSMSLAQEDLEKYEDDHNISKALTGIFLRP